MIYLGIDVGNFDTKSQNTTMPSGYEGPYYQRPMLSSHFIKFENQYYIPSEQRLYYLQDKTKDGRALILTLISIANELIYKFGKSGDTTPENIQKGISSVTEIALGVGLPVSHYKKNFIDDLIQFYTERMGNGISFIYDGYSFNFSMRFCRVYPQGGAAAACKQNKFSKIYNTYYIFDIGGYTIDIAMFKNGVPTKDKISLEMGIMILYDNIIEKINQNFDLSIDANVIQDVLSNEPTTLNDDVKSFIKTMSEKHASDIINKLRQLKIMFDAYPCLFIGGGSLLLKPYILKNPIINKEATQFIHDTRANAKGYARLIKSELSVA